jgi:hypothetical protein
VLILATLFPWLGGSARRIGPGVGGIAPRLPRPGLPLQTRTISARGWITVSGKVAIAMGIVLVATGLVMWLSASVNVRRAFAIVAVVAGTVAASFVAARMGTVINQTDVAARARRIQVTRNLEPGIFVALLGGLSGLAGGVVLLSAFPVAAVRPTSGPGPAGWTVPAPTSGPPPGPTGAEQKPATPAEPASPAESATETIPTQQPATELPRPAEVSQALQ